MAFKRYQKDESIKEFSMIGQIYHTDDACLCGRHECMWQVTSLREIQALQRLSPHPNVIKLLEVLL